MDGSRNFRAGSGTLAGAPVTLTGPSGTQAWLIFNDHATNTFDFVLGGQTVKVKPGEALPIPVVGQTATLDGTGAYRWLAFDDAAAMYGFSRSSALGTGALVDGSVTTVKLADDAVTAGKIAADAVGSSEIAAGAVGAAEMEAGAAGAGIAGPKVKFTAATAVGALPAATVPVMLELDVANAPSGDNDWTGLVGKHEVIGFEAQVGAAGDAANSYQLQTAGGVAVTDAVAPGAVAGDFKRCAKIDPAQAVFVDGAGIRIAHVRTAGSSLARCRVYLVPVA